MLAMSATGFECSENRPALVKVATWLFHGK